MRKLSRRAMQTAFRVRRKTLIVDLGGLRSVLSSAPRAGGITRARYILNHQVAAKPIGRDDCGMGAGARCADPARTLSKLATSLGIRDKFVGLMTAVSLADLVTVREAYDQIWVEGFVTVGTSNAVRAGEPVTPRQRHQQPYSSWHDQLDPRDQRSSVRFGNGRDGAGGDRSQDCCPVACEGEELDRSLGGDGNRNRRGRGCEWEWTSSCGTVEPTRSSVNSSGE